ncbi:hypothetical protein [Desulfobacter curvatus]|nr:hypothetical protein [Desulfobacter curvatus]
MERKISTTKQNTNAKLKRLETFGDSSDGGKGRVFYAGMNFKFQYLLT